jgi:hypothetical protein
MKAWVALGILLLGVLAAGACLARRGAFASPEVALARFVSASPYDVAEDQLMDPLILAGPKVVPLLAKSISNRQMVHRRYAVMALGHLGDQAALPALTKIVVDVTDEGYVRCDALQAVGLIKNAAARDLVERIDLGDVCPREVASIRSGDKMRRKTWARVACGAPCAW